MQPHGYDSHRRTSGNTEKIFRRFADNSNASILAQLRMRYSRRTSLGAMLVATFMVVAVRGATPFAPLDLGTLGGTVSGAASVSNNGVVVGSSNTPGDTTSHGFTWSRARGMLDLGTLGGSYSAATAVSHNGRFVVGS